MTALLSLLINLLRAVISGAMLWRLRHVAAQEWAIAALLVSCSAAGAGLVMVTHVYGRPAFSLALLRRRMGEGLVFALSYSTTGIYNDIDKAMLGRYGLDVANGIYTMAYRVVDVCATPLYSVQAAALPRFFQEGVAGARTAADYAVRIVKRTAPLALVSAAMMLVTAPVIPLLAGGGFRESVAALRWLCLLPLFRSFHLSAGDALTGAGHQKLRLGTQALAAGFNFAANLYLIPHYGWHGAAWSSLATDGGLAALNWLIIARLLRGERESGF